MIDALTALLEDFGSRPVLQGLLAALATFVLEDAATVVSGLLVADGRMSFVAAFAGLSLGIALGDLGLYAVGRFAGNKTLEWGWLKADRLERARRWFERNLIVAVIVSRFVPGSRVPTYMGAGICGAPIVRFALLTAGASIFWTLLVLCATAILGRVFLDHLGPVKWPAGLAIVCAVVWIQSRARKHGSKDQGENSPVASYFEFWPAWLFYLPVGAYYLWLSMRYGGLTVPTAANPTIFAGGFIGESKGQILDLVAGETRRWIAPYVRLAPRDATSTLLVSDAECLMEAHGLAYPIVAKPDRGQRGAAVRIVRSTDELRDYLEMLPAGAPVLLQELIEYKHEAGIMYIRQPGMERGRVFSLTQKHFPAVSGDGVRTLRELILADRRARLIAPRYFARHVASLDRVPASGERVELVFAGNHAQGAVFTDGSPLLTPALEARIESFAKAIPGFYFGRFDIRYESPESFGRGEGLRIIEINGAGAEATHIWDARMGLIEAYRVLFEQFRLLFEIGATNRALGHRPVGVLALLREIVNYQRLSARYVVSH